MKAIVNAKLKTMAPKKRGVKVKEEYESGVILIDGDKIKAVGSAKDVRIPKNAEIIDAKGRLVLPGFVDAHSHLGMWEECIGFEGSDGNEATDPITPHLRAIDAIYPLDEGFANARAGGVTSVVTGPGSANVIGGQFAAIKTAGHAVDDMIIKAPVAMKCAFGENPKRVYNSRNVTPTTRMAVAALLRDTLNKTKDYAARKKAAKNDPMKKPPFDSKLEAMIPVVEGKLPLKIHAHRCDDILTAIRIVKEFNLKASLDHCTDGSLIAKEVKASGFSAIIGPSFGVKTKLELRNKSFKTAADLYNAGVKVAIMTDCPVHEQGALPLFAGMAVKAGLPREEALKAITINAAEISGIDDRVGSIEPGKDADIVIWDKDPLTVEAKTWKVLIGGEEV